MPGTAPEKHARDEDCTLDETGTCTLCGRHHSDPCPRCGARAFHLEACDLAETFDEAFGEA